MIWWIQKQWNLTGNHITPGIQGTIQSGSSIPYIYNKTKNKFYDVKDKT